RSSDLPSLTVEEPDAGQAPHRATGTWTLQFRQVGRDQGTETLSTGEYSGVYVVEDDRWVMAECLFTPGWSVTRSLEDATVTVPEVDDVPGAALERADTRA